MKNKKKNLLGLMRCIIFTVIFALLFVEVAYVLVPKVRDDATDDNINVISAYKSLDKDTVDLVIFGNSDAYRALNPIKIYLDTGITACVIGTPDISMGEIYYRAKDLIKYQSPKYFVLETDCMFAEPNYFDDDGNYIEPEDDEQTNDYGTSAIQTKFNEIENDVEVAIDSKYPLIKYNYRWKQISLSELKGMSRKKEFTAKGFMTSGTVNGFKYGDVYMGTQDGKTEEYDINVLKYFNKFIELCDENNIALSLVSVPSGCSWNWHKHNTVEQLAQEKGITFVDFNAQTDLIPTFDWTEDTKDFGLHLNNTGARKVTSAYESILTDELGLTATQLTDEEKAKWDEDAQIFCEKNFNYDIKNKRRLTD